MGDICKFNSSKPRQKVKRILTLNAMLGSSWGSSQSGTDAKQNAIVTQRVAPNDALLRVLGQHYDHLGQ